MQRRRDCKTSRTTRRREAAVGYVALGLLALLLLSFRAQPERFSFVARRFWVRVAPLAWLGPPTMNQRVITMFWGSASQ
jgi:hypothetical protein